MANLPSPIEELHHPDLEEKEIQLFIKRDDLIHSEIMGNKWRKLKYNIEEANKLGKKTILTLGGAYSNHIHATAAAGKEFGFKTVGLIRGDELNSQSNETLKFAASKGMELQFLDRETYRNLRGDLSELEKLNPDSYVLAEGGTNKLAIEGCAELIQEIDIDYNVIVLPIGTGGTFCGVLQGVSRKKSVLGISTLKGDFIYDELENLMRTYKIEKMNYSIESNYHFGGYGKTTSSLIDFINWFKEIFHIQLDPIYTGKSFFGVWDMIKNDKFEKNLKIVLLHTGGLQGISGFNRKNQNIIQ